MKLKELQFNWDKFGEQDPLWAILTDNNKKGNKWDREEFFNIGKAEIKNLLESLEQAGIKISFGKALDFGCGVGRLSQALAEYFQEVCGVDIAPSMIKLAQEYNRYGERCQYFLNDTDQLKFFADNTFDLIYSNITLQHIEPQFSKKYIQEFLRILAPQGVLVFQIPSERVPDSSTSNQVSENQSNLEKIRQWVKQLVPLSVIDAYRQIRYGQDLSKRALMEMHGIPKEEVIQLIEAVPGVEIVQIQPNNLAGNQWISFQYWVKKN